MGEMALALGRKAKYETMTEMVATTTSEAIQKAMNMKEVDEADADMVEREIDERGVMSSETETGEKDMDMGVMESVLTTGESEKVMGVPERETGVTPQEEPGEKKTELLESVLTRGVPEKEKGEKPVETGERGEVETSMEVHPKELVTVEAIELTVDQTLVEIEERDVPEKLTGDQKPVERGVPEKVMGVPEMLTGVPGDATVVMGELEKVMGEPETEAGEKEKERGLLETVSVETEALTGEYMPEGATGIHIPFETGEPEMLTGESEKVRGVPVEMGEIAMAEAQATSARATRRTLAERMT